MSGLSRYKTELLDILKSVVLNPVFPQEELEKLRQRTISNLISEKSEPDALVDKLRRKLVYGDGAYGAYKTEESVASIQRDDLIAFHSEHLIPNNASLAIVGDFNGNEEIDRVSSVFSDWKRSELPVMAELSFQRSMDKPSI